MEFVESDDGPPFRRPPALDDRIWRHPSEIGVAEAHPGRLVSHRTVWVAAAVAALGASVLSAGLVIALGGVTTREIASGQTVTTTASSPPATVVELVVGIAERVRPSIVQIKATRTGAGVSGSGVFLRPDGHVITNYHVVDNASNLTVVLSSGREMPARLIGSDADTDTAVVKVDGGPFPAADIGTAVTLKVGQTAVAMGSPLALAGGPSVTVGVISALHRTVRTRGSTTPLHDMIQTDAPISPGSSGGALLDGQGRVIGITTAVAVSDVGPEGLGFATAIDVARSIADELIATGKATHSWMGISGRDLDGATAHDLNLDGAVRITSVVPDSPAAKGGLADNDIVMALNGKPLGSMGALVAALRQYRPGDTVTLDVMHDRERSMKTVTLVERPEGQ